MTAHFLIGMGCCVLAGVFFGTNYLPLKQVDCGDGFFFAAAMSLGILAVGAVVNFALSTGPVYESAEFYPLAMLGGMSWMLGNLMTPTIIKRLGLGLGLTVWDLSNMILGWATGSFGLFGVQKELVSHPWWNRIGLALCCLSLVFFAQAGESEKLRERSKTRDLADLVACWNEDSDPDLALGDVEGTASGVGPAKDRTKETEGEQQLDLEAGDPKAAGASAAGFVADGACAACQGVVGACAGEAAGGEVLAAAKCVSPRSSNDSTAAPSCGAADEAKEAPPRASARKPTALTVRTGVSVRTVQQGQARWAVGFVMALAAGLLFGWTFNMPILLMQCAKSYAEHSDSPHAVVCDVSAHDRWSSNPFNYVFSHFCGIVLTSLVTLVSYIAVRREKAFLPRNIMGPSVLSGVMWGIAQAAWFEANERLSVVIAFPIISMLPGVVALFVGFVFFGELESRRSRVFAGLGLLLRVPGVALIALSGGGP